MSATGAKRTFPVPTLREDPMSRELPIRDIVAATMAEEIENEQRTEK
jgi:hypothetical protein